MTLADRFLSAVLFVLGAAYLFEASKLPAWRGTTMGPGLFPMILGTAMVVLAGTMLLLSVRGSAPAGTHGGFFPPRDIRRLQAWLLGASAAYILALEPIGFVVSTFVFVSVLSMALGPTRRSSSIIVAALVVLGSYLFLVSFLKLTLPRGVLG